MKLSRVISILVLAVACGTDPAFNVSGAWDFSSSISSDQSAVACDATGDLLLSQSSNGSRFTGQRAQTATCTNAPAGFSLDGAAGIIGGEVSGNRISFEADFCQHEGTLASENEMSGTITCEEVLVGGDIESFSGTWQATR